MFKVNCYTFTFTFWFCIGRLGTYIYKPKDVSSVWDLNGVRSAFTFKQCLSVLGVKSSFKRLAN